MGTLYLTERDLKTLSLTKRPQDLTIDDFRTAETKLQIATQVIYTHKGRDYIIKQKPAPKSKEQRKVLNLKRELK
jgi:hypothetical protein